MMESSGGGIIFTYSLIVLMVGALTVNCSYSIYYVTAEGKEQDCPVIERCYDLSYHISHNFRSSSRIDNTIFRLLPGTHYIPDGQVLYIGFANNLVIEGYNATIIQGFHETVQQSTVIIQCIGQTGGISTFLGYNITLRGLTIINCGSEIQNEGYFSVYASSTSNLFFYHISIQNSTQFGLLTRAIRESLVIESCSFARNSLEISKKFPCSNGICHGGNAIIALISGFTNVNIINSNFSFSISASYGNLPLSSLLVSVGRSSANITLDSIVVYGNSGNLGANIVLVANGASGYTFTLKNSLSTMANYQYDSSFGTSLGGGFLAIISDFGIISDFNSITDNKIQIMNSTFTNNAATYGGGICILHLQDSYRTSIEVISSMIENNSGIIGIGIAVINNLTVMDSLSITNTTISSSIISYSVNTFALSNLGSISSYLEPIQLKYLNGVDATSSDGATSYSSAIGLFNAYKVTFKDVTIIDNSVTGIRAFRSRVMFKGVNNVIEGNNGINGSGLALIDESFIVLNISTTVSFINNSAIKGGGIFTDEQSYADNTCFYAVQPCHNLSSINVIFKGNVASKGGSALYGEDIEHCLIHSDYNSSYSSSDIFNMVFDYSEEYGNSVISSDPFKVCLCENSVANCSQRTHHVSSFPGGIVDIQGVLVGERDGFSTGTLLVQLENYMSPFSISVPYCHNAVSFTMNYTNMTSIDVVLSVDNVNGRNTEGVNITISIEECPNGFPFNKTELVCDCPFLINDTIPTTTCNVNDRSIMKGSTGWIGFDTSSCILFGAECPFDYCTTNINNITITLEDQSQQCVMNRSGILCGQCKGNYSLLLGSNECGECPHYGYLALLIVFIVAGVALVVLLIVLNLTVSMSTINGLIFFANIVHINENSILISTGHVPVLSQFISWINLDFGFKVCFYPGMDSYAKTWLQFVFPFYIWFIIALIIFSAKYSTRISRLVSRNIISVLATLILLSYTKLFRAIIFSFYRSNLIKICDDITTTIVWSADGSVNYFSLKHAPLFILSLMVLVLLIIPFTLSLLLSPLLESYLSRYKLFKWWIKLKPFLDAYNGPYKDRYRFWTGLLLLARLVIVLTVSINSISFSSNLHVDRLVTLTVAVLLLSYVWIVDGVYTNFYSNMLERFFIVNLITTTVASGYGPDDNINIRQVLVYSCISLSMVVFLLIILYHIWMRCSENKFIKKCYTKVIESRRKEEDPSQSNYNPSIELRSQRKTSDVDIVNRNKSRDDVTHTDCSIEMMNTKEIRKRESMIFDD